MLRTLFASACLLIALFARPALAAPGDVLHVFRDPTPAVGNNFGFSVTTVDDRILVSAPRADQAGHDMGAAFLFNASSGELTRTFLPTHPVLGGFFAQNAIAGVGGNVLVGDPGDDTVLDDAGAVFLFSGDTGELLRTFRNGSPAAGDGFGYTVGAFGSDVLIGQCCNGPGAVHLYNGTTGESIRTFDNPTPDAGDEFGFSFAASGNKVVIGDYQDDTNAVDSGAIYLFDGSTGARLLTILNPTPEGGDGFGRSLDFIGDDILVGAWSDNAGADNAGAAYLFDGHTGNLLQTFLNPDPATNDQFGNSIAAVGKNVLVGAYFDGQGAPEAGSAYLFDAASGRFLLGIHNPDASSGDSYNRFGWSVAAYGNNLLVSANGGGTYEPPIGGTDCDCQIGAVYLIEGVPEPAGIWTAAAGALMIAFTLFKNRKAAAHVKLQENVCSGKGISPTRFHA